MPMLHSHGGMARLGDEDCHCRTLVNKGQCGIGMGAT